MLITKRSQNSLPMFGREFWVYIFTVLVISSFWVRFSFFYKSAHVSQSIFSLLFLDLILIFFLFYDKQKKINISFPLLILLSSGIGVLLSQKNDATVLAVLGLYLLCIGLMSATRLWRHAPLFLSYTALISAIYSLGLYVGAKFGLTDLHNAGRISGSYGQANLQATLMLLGLFSYFQLISTTGRKRIIYLIPALLLTVVLFMTASRAGLMALSFSSLLVIGFWRHEKLIPLRSHFIHFFFVIIIGWTIAQVVGDWTPLARAEKTWSDDGGTYLRLVYWLAAILMGRDYWLTGTGFGGYARNLGDYTVQSVDLLHLPYELISQTLWAHNDFLHILAEHGVFVFLLVVTFVVVLMVSFWKQKSCINFFTFLGCLSFLCMMCFSHPLYYHNLVLMACFAFAPLLGRWRGFKIEISQKTLAIIVVVPVFLVNFFVIGHCLQMFHLQEFRRYMVTSKTPFTERFKTGQSQFLTENINNPIYGWQFKHTLFTNLVEKLQETDDQGLARHIQEDMLLYSKDNHFSSYSFTLAKLYYILGEYEGAKYYANFAFERKPDDGRYFALLHLCNALLISKKNNIKIYKLIPEEEITKLEEQKVFRPRQFSPEGIAL